MRDYRDGAVQHWFSEQPAGRSRASGGWSMDFHRRGPVGSFASAVEVCDEEIKHGPGLDDMQSSESTFLVLTSHRRRL